MGFWSTFICGMGAGVGALMVILLSLFREGSPSVKRTQEINERSVAALEERNEIDRSIAGYLARVAASLEESAK